MNLATLRLHNQRLVGPPLASPREAVRWLGAVQAQDYQGGKWGVAQRTAGADDAALDRAFDAGEILRLHAMRPTWHFVAPEDVRWVLGLTSPRVHAVNGHMYRRLELDEPVFRRAHSIFTRALRDGRCQTRGELAEALEADGIPARGQRLAYLVMHAELEGLLCSGPRQGKQHSYALLEERAPPVPTLSREEALAALAGRYFASHGPATPHDFAWWSGLTVTDARRGIDSLGTSVERVEVDGTAYWMVDSPAAPVPDGPMVHLLPNYDEHVVAYRNHGPTVHPGAREALRGWANAALDAHLLCVDGLITGGWKRALGKQSAELRVNPLVPLSAEDRAALRRAADDYGRFVGLPVEVEMQSHE